MKKILFHSLTIPPDNVSTGNLVAEIASKFVLEIIDQFTRLRKFLYEFLNKSNDEKIFSTFVNDFHFFNDAFKNIHKIGI